MAYKYGQSSRPDAAYIVVYRGKRGDGTEYEHIYGPLSKQGASAKLAYEAKYGVKSEYHIEKMTGTWEPVE